MVRLLVVSRPRRLKSTTYVMLTLARISHQGDGIGLPFVP